MAGPTAGCSGLRLACWPGRKRLQGICQGIELGLAQLTSQQPGQRLGSLGRAQGNSQQPTVEARLQRLPLAIQQRQADGVLTLVQTLQPEGLTAINQEGLAIDRDLQTPAAVLGLEVLQWCVAEQPVQQHRLLTDPGRRRNNQQLRRSGRSQALRGFPQPVHGDLCIGPDGLNGLTPWAHGEDADAMAARTEVLHPDRSVDVGESLQRSLIHQQAQMGSQAQCPGIDQWPVAHLQSQLQAVAADRAAVPGAADRHRGAVSVEPSAQGQNGRWRCHLMDRPPGGAGRNHPGPWPDDRACCWLVERLPAGPQTHHQQQGQAEPDQPLPRRGIPEGSGGGAMRHAVGQVCLHSVALTAGSSQVPWALPAVLCGHGAGQVIAGQRRQHRDPQ